MTLSRYTSLPVHNISFTNGLSFAAIKGLVALITADGWIAAAITLLRRPPLQTLKALIGGYEKPHQHGGDFSAGGFAFRFETAVRVAADNSGSIELLYRFFCVF